jgi:hypothetical protein
MPDILIRNVSAWTMERLRRRARRHGKSLEADLRDALERIASEDDGRSVTGPGFGTWLVSISRPGAELSKPLDALRSASVRLLSFE